jgi:AraC-like DNA-binding protein
MSSFRQTNRSAALTPIVRSLGLRLPGGHQISEHQHPWGQLIYASRGMLSVEAISKQWLVLPARAVWAPAGVAHQIETLGETWMRTVYLRPDLAATLPSVMQVLNVSPLLKELLAEAVHVGVLDEADRVHQALATMLLDRLAGAQVFEFALPLPVDGRARCVAKRAQESLDRDESLAKLTRGLGLSARTAERIFAKETGLSFGRWRQQARLQRAVRLLSEGRSVTNVALDCGYSSVSAFVAMFKKCLGATPGQYLG